jgi:hypothetical protein
MSFGYSIGERVVVLVSFFIFNSSVPFVHSWAGFILQTHFHLDPDIFNSGLRVHPSLVWRCLAESRFTPQL